MPDGIFDNVFVTGNIGIGISSTAPATARLELKSQESPIGTIKLFPNSGAGRDFSYDGGTDNVFLFSHYGQGTGRTEFIWDNGGSPIPLLTLENEGNVGIGISDPGAPLHVKRNMAVGPFAATNGEGRIEVTGKLAEFSFVDRRLTSWPATPEAGDRFVWYNQDKKARIWTQTSGDLLTVTANGNVGIGTTNPQYARLMIQDAAVPLAFRESDRSVTEGGLWRMPLDAGVLRFDVNTSAAGNFSTSLIPLAMYPNGDVKAAGDVYARGVKLQCSRELKENFAELSGADAVEALRNLNPVKFNYKADSDKNQYIGFIAEEVPELVATSDRKTLNPMDIVAVLTQVVKEQQKAMAALAEKVKRLEAQTA